MDKSSSIGKFGSVILIGFVINVFLIFMSFSVIPDALMYLSFEFGILLTFIMAVYFIITPGFKVDLAILIVLAIAGFFIADEVFDIGNPLFYILLFCFIYSGLIPVNFIYVAIVRNIESNENNELKLIYRNVARVIFIVVSIFCFVFLSIFLSSMLYAISG